MSLEKFINSINREKKNFAILSEFNRLKDEAERSNT